jgi:S1-C subfamily serine protease
VGVTPPAARAGLQPGDLIQAIDGKKVSSTAAFIQTVDADAPGTTITLTVNRGGSQHQVKVTLGTRPNTPAGG